MGSTRLSAATESEWQWFPWVIYVRSYEWAVTNHKDTCQMSCISVLFSFWHALIKEECYPLWLSHVCVWRWWKARSHVQVTLSLSGLRASGPEVMKWCGGQYWMRPSALPSCQCRTLGHLLNLLESQFHNLESLEQIDKKPTMTILLYHRYTVHPYPNA